MFKNKILGKMRFFNSTIPLLVLVALFKANLVSGANNVTINVPGLGLIKGKSSRTAPEGASGVSRDYISFTSIPYGNITKRFLPAEMRAPLTTTMGKDVFDGTKPQLPCWQIEHPLFPGPFTEDCLTLNIDIPKIPSAGGKLLPVIFFIHGGAFVYGSGNRFDGRRLLNRDVVYVSINYRLNVFGFLSLDDNDAPGNAGIYDQVLALKWVKKYIRYFGGDPKRITIAGQSAGAASVRYLLDSPMTVGLYHGAIAASGDNTAAWATQVNPRAGGLKAASVLGCFNSSNSSHTVYTALNCMRNLSPQQILQASGALQVAPSIQTFNLTSYDKVTPTAPLDVLKNGNISRVPLMIGCTRNDGSFLASSVYTNFLVPSGRINDTEYMKYQFLKDLLNSPFLGIPDSPLGLHDTVLHTFFGENKYSGEWKKIAPGIVDLVTVYNLKAPAFLTAKYFSKHSNTYLYSFDYNGEQTWYQYFAGVQQVPRGVGHADDLMYIFYNEDFSNRQDKLMSTKMIDLWTNFATNLNPNGARTLPQWPVFTRESGLYYRINTSSTVDDNYAGHWFGATEPK